MVEEALDPRRVEALGLQQVEDDAGVELAGAGAHRQAVDGGEAHRAVDAAPVMEGAQRGAGAQMADHHPALRQSWVDLAQPVGDVLVGQAVKAVAAHALLVPAVRDREPVGDLGMAAMERGVEARDLGHLRPPRADLRGSAPDCSAGAAAPGAPAARAAPAPRRPPGSARRNPGRHGRPGGRSRAGRCRAGRAATPRSGPVPRPRPLPRPAGTSSSTSIAPVASLAARCGLVPMPSS